MKFGLIRGYSIESVNDNGQRWRWTPEPYNRFGKLKKNKKNPQKLSTVKSLKFGTPQTNAITVLKIEKFDVTLH